MNFYGPVKLKFIQFIQIKSHSPLGKAAWILKG